MASRFLLVSVFALLPVHEVSADTLEVPGEFPTIQAAIDAAVDGDEVLVAPGSYNERIDYLGKAIAVRSSAGPEVTTIDGDDTGFGPVVFVTESDKLAPGDPERVLNGFTITNGTNGVEVEATALRIINCAMNDNGNYGLASTSSIVIVDGASCSFNGSQGMQCNDSTLTMSDVTVEGNSDNGGIRLIGCQSTLTDCVIRDNEMFYCYAAGGGLYVTGGTLTLTRCEVSGHQLYASSCAGTTGATGGGIFLESCEAELYDCQIFGNSARPSGTSKIIKFEGGGGVRVIGGSLLMDGCILRENLMINENFLGIGAHGGAIRIDNGACVFTNCTFDQNAALDEQPLGAGGDSNSGFGGAIWIAAGNLEISNCSFTRNSTVGPSSAGGAIYGGSPTISDSFFCSNDPDHIDAAWVDGGGNVFLKSCIDGDLDFDGDVDFDDFTQLLANWGDPGCNGATPCNADIDGDGDVDFDDFTTLLANWT